MNQSKVELFLESLEEQTLILARWVISRSEATEKTMNDIVCLGKEDFIDAIVNMKPTNIKMITNFVYIIKQYAIFVGNKNAEQMIAELDRNVIWEVCKKKGIKKNFVSKAEFEQLVADIKIFEEFNKRYYHSLLECIYYGVYNEDLSVITNLRKADIDTKAGIITLRPDDKEPYSITVPEHLINNLMFLSDTNEWRRKNRFNEFGITISGKYDDSCFKIEDRGCGNNYRYSYFSRIRKMTKEYLGYAISPQNLYISGLMYRIELELSANGMTVEDAFGKHTRSSYKIIQEILSKYHYTREVKYFRQAVSGRLNDFK